VPGFHGSRRFVVSKRSLVYQQVGVVRGFNGCSARASVTGQYHTSSPPRGSDQCIGVDNPPVVECDGLPFMDLAPQRTLRNAELSRGLRIESTQSVSFDQGVTYGRRSAMVYRETLQVIVITRDFFAVSQLGHFDWKSDAFAPQTDALSQRFRSALGPKQMHGLGTSL